jgi:hypothetical protein
MRLLLAAAPENLRPNRIEVACASGTDTVIWNDTDEQPIVAVAGVDRLEAILSTVDARLQGRKRPEGEPREVRGRGNGASRSEPPKSPLASGVSVGISAERWSKLSGWGVGPQLEVAVGPNPVFLAYGESLRFALNRDSGAIALDFQFGAAWGAPFSATFPLGVVGLAGVEWLSQPRRPSAAPAPTATLGLRGALPFRWLRPWIGVYGRYWGGGEAIDRFQVLASAGVFIPVAARQRRKHK